MLLPIESVRVGDRLREDMGDLDGLAASIKRYGLIQPIVVDDSLNLVAGGRRLVACKQLGWTEIDAVDYGSLSESERREIELEENLRRKDLTAYERSKTITQLADTAKEIALSPSPDTTIETRTDSVQVSKPTRGPSQQPDSERAISDRTGIPPTTLREAKQHVSTADTYPFMQRPEWKQYHVLEAKERLEKLPEAERPEVAAFVNQPGIPPKEAINILTNIAEMSAEDRAEVFRLKDSGDGRERSLALTRTAQKIPMPDPRLLILQEAVDALKRASTRFANEPETPRLKQMTQELQQMIQTIREGYQCLKIAEQARFERSSNNTVG